MNRLSSSLLSGVVATSLGSNLPAQEVATSPVTTLEEGTVTENAPVLEGAVTAQEAVAGESAETAEATAEATAAGNAAAAAFAPGQAVPALPELESIQGEPLLTTLNEPGKVYVIDCWATWCGPCIAAMPHLAELHQTFKDRGLKVLAVNVWEDNAAGVRSFVAENQEKMPFAVALSGPEDGPFAKTWLEAAGVESIPSTFVIKDGKLVYHGHPMSLDEETIEAILADNFDLGQFTAQQAEKQRKQQEVQQLIQTLVSNNDWQGIIDNDEKLQAADPQAARFLVLTARVKLGQFDQLETMIASLPPDSGTELDQGDAYGVVAANAASSEELKDFAKKALVALRGLPEPSESRVKFMDLLTLLRFEALAGEDATVRQATLDEVSGLIDGLVKEDVVPLNDAEQIKTKLKAANAAAEFPPLESVLGE